MVRKVKIYGASDDLVEVRMFKDGDWVYRGMPDGWPDEISAIRPVTLQIAGLNPDGKAEGLLVYAGYDQAPGPCWTIGVSMLDEDRPLPDWPMGFVTEHGYSPALVLELPDWAQIQQVKDPTRS